MAESTAETSKKLSFNRVAHFRVAIRSNLKQISKCISLEKFTEIFADVGPLRGSSTRMRKLWMIYQESMLNNMISEFEEFVTEENLEEKFNLLSKMKMESPLDENTEAWRPVTGDVQQQLRSHDMKEMLKRKKELENFVLEKEMRVEYLRKIVARQRVKRQKLQCDVTLVNQVLEDESKGAEEAVGSMHPFILEDIM